MASRLSSSPVAVRGRRLLTFFEIVAPFNIKAKLFIFTIYFLHVVFITHRNRKYNENSNVLFSALLTIICACTKTCAFKDKQLSLFECMFT